MTFLLEGNKNKYILNHKIGHGATCECFIGHKINEEKSELFAIKIFKQKNYQFYSNEISLLSTINKNDNIIKLYSYGQGYLFPIINDENTDNYNNEKEIIYYQILEYASNGELKDYVNGKNSRIPENISAKLFLKIVLGVKFLHENNIAHCDLKPENILLDKYFNPKINDFGFSQKFNGKNGDYLLHKRSGTPIYSSPDVRLAFTKGYDGVKNDIFSLGVLLFVITIGEFPFESATYSDDKYKFIIKGRFPKFWENFNDIDISDEFKDLINRLISLNPAKRLTIDEIIKHPWIIKNVGVIPTEQKNSLSEESDYINELYDKEIIDEFTSREKFT